MPIVGWFQSERLSSGLRTKPQPRIHTKLSAYCPSAHCLLVFIARPNRCFDVAADVEVAFDFYAQRITGGDKIFEDQVDDMLVKDFYVAERINVELQTLQLDAAFIRNILEPDRGKIRKVRKRTDAGELRNFEIYLYLFARILIRKSIERIKIHFR